MVLPSVAHSMDDAGKRYKNGTYRSNVQPSPDSATFYGSIDCAGPSADGANRSNALDIYIRFQQLPFIYRIIEALLLI